MESTSVEEAAVQLATSTIRELFARYEIDDPTQAKRLIRERATQPELERFKLARDVLDGSGALG